MRCLARRRADSCALGVKPGGRFARRRADGCAFGCQTWGPLRPRARCRLCFWVSNPEAASPEGAPSVALLGVKPGGRFARGRAVGCAFGCQTRRPLRPKARCRLRFWVSNLSEPDALRLRAKSHPVRRQVTPFAALSEDALRSRARGHLVRRRVWQRKTGMAIIQAACRQPRCAQGLLSQSGRARARSDQMNAKAAWR